MMLAHEVNMQRLRLKADGRIVELRDGQEFPLAPTMPGPALAVPGRPSGARACLQLRPSSLTQRRTKRARCRPCATCAAARS